MTIAGVLWGTIGPAAAIVDEHTSLSPLQTSFWRLAIAALPLTLLPSGDLPPGVPQCLPDG
jgi:drug/metabolite transporter (DMT)-like permease